MTEAQGVEHNKIGQVEKQRECTDAYESNRNIVIKTEIWPQNSILESTF